MIARIRLLNTRIAFALAIVLNSVFCLVTTSIADVRLPAIFTDHAVLQRDMAVPVWGWADPGEEVTVTIAGQTHKAIADAKGKWRVTLTPLAVGEPLQLVVQGKNRIERNDILVGEVWLCSGQSNMEWSVGASSNADLEIPAANHPQIRLVRVKGEGSQEPVEDFDGKWEVCSPATIGNFSAVGYFFGRALQEHLGVPIGLIDNSWGGSACESWIRKDRLENNPMFAALMERWSKIKSEEDVAREKEAFDKTMAEWQKKADAAKAAGEPEPPFRPWWPGNPLKGNQRPANLYHGRVGPVLGYGIRGVIWYQGETNAGRAYQYREMFPLMISSWREDWKQGDFPFYFVQLADFGAEKPEPGDSGWAELREAQTMTQDKLPNTGQAVIIDIGEGADIHPRNKLEVANRLARWALAETYGKSFVHKSPRYDSMEAKDGAITVKFKEAGEGLRSVDAFEVQGFAIAGDDKKWVWAKARITAPDQVVVSSDQVAKPVAVRYAWGDNPVCNLYNNVGLPVTPFRTDDWPGLTAEAR